MLLLKNSLLIIDFRPIPELLFAILPGAGYRAEELASCLESLVDALKAAAVTGILLDMGRALERIEQERYPELARILTRGLRRTFVHRVAIFVHRVAIYGAASSCTAKFSTVLEDLQREAGHPAKVRCFANEGKAWEWLRNP